MMTLKISVFRILFFISPSINPNVLCFIQMSSSDDEAQSPDIGASGPKGSPPPLQSESADDEDLLPKTKRKKGHRRPRIAIMRGRNHGRGCDKAADTHRVQVRYLCASYLFCLCELDFVLKFAIIRLSIAVNKNSDGRSLSSLTDN